MRKRTAFTFDDKLFEKVERIRRELNLKSQSEVFMRALSLLELSLGRKIEFKEDGNSFEINSFEDLRQSVKLDEIEEKKDNKK